MTVFQMRKIIKATPMYFFFLILHQKKRQTTRNYFHIILSYLAVFPLIEFLLPGQKIISTLLGDILTILGIMLACKVFLDCFYN
jgi:hypothetical protein